MQNFGKYCDFELLLSKKEINNFLIIIFVLVCEWLNITRHILTNWIKIYWLCSSVTCSGHTALTWLNIAMRFADGALNYALSLVRSSVLVPILLWLQGYWEENVQCKTFIRYLGRLRGALLHVTLANHRHDLWLCFQTRNQTNQAPGRRRTKGFRKKKQSYLFEEKLGFVRTERAKLGKKRIAKHNTF